MKSIENSNGPTADQRHTRRRNRKLMGLALTTALISVALPSVSHAFQAPPIARRTVQTRAVTDPDVLLGTNESYDILSQKERLKLLYLQEDSIGDSISDNLDSTKEKVQFKGLSTTAADPKRRRAVLKSTNILSPSRSSTMPGFGAETARRKAYKASARLMEQKSGRNIEDSTSAREQRRKANGEQMYKTSSSVPESMIQFAEEIHEQDRISRAEEIILGEKTQEAVHLQNIYDQLALKLDREPTDEEWCAAAGKINMAAISQTIEEGLEAKNKLVTSNLRMVQSVVNTYIRNGLSAQYNAGDMMQEGIIALIRAAEKFEPDRGWKFSTYAMYWVRASVKRSQLYQSRTVTVPQRIHENYKRLLKVERDLEVSLGRRPTREEMGAEVGLSKLQVDRVFLAMRQRCVSLDQEIQNSNKPMSSQTSKDTLIDLISHKTADTDQSKLERKYVQEDLIQTMNNYLDPFEVELLLLRYGIKQLHGDSSAQPTIAELSRRTGYKPDKVRRTINRALKKLRDNGGDEWYDFERVLL